MLQAREPFNNEEREVVAAALNPYLLLELPTGQGCDQTFAELYDLLENEPNRDEIMAAVVRADGAKRHTGCNVVSVYRAPSKPQLYEYFVAAENRDVKTTPVMWGYSENLTKPLGTRVFDLAWHNLEYRSFWRQLRQRDIVQVIVFFGLLLAIGVGMLFGAHWAEKTFGGILLILIGYCFWHLLIYDRREYNHHVSKVESYLRKLELFPKVSPRRNQLS